MSTAAANKAGVVDACEALAQRHVLHTDDEDRRSRGQVFTPAAVARFMAARFGRIGRTFRLLDPGAGAGILSAAFCERVLSLESPRAIAIEAFESDPSVLPVLEETLRLCARRLRASGHDLEFVIRTEDFLLSASVAEGQTPLFGAPSAGFDGAIMNPPYFKIGGHSDHARALRDVVHGQPNAYGLFMAAAVGLLADGGELVAITPRSFCNGVYFRGLRRWFFDRMALRHLHLFQSRTDTFEGAKVLQESLISCAVKTPDRTAPVGITTSIGRDLPVRCVARATPSALVVDDSCGDMVIRIPVDDLDVAVMCVVEGWPKCFSDQELVISTGPVVSFRATEFLRPEPDAPGSVPLIAVHNVRRFETAWPLPKRQKPQSFVVSPASMTMLLPTRNYVFLRRFSAKEEPRRLTASPFLPAATPVWRGAKIAIENHVNYVRHATRDLTEAETLGLTALFNSRLLDRYFRLLSGNTQVNATEIRTMPFPGLSVLARIGRRLATRSADFDDRAERAVNEVLGVDLDLSVPAASATA